MANFKEVVLDILTVVILVGLLSVTSNVAIGQENSCVTVMRHNILQSFQTLSPETSEDTFVNEICSGQKKSKGKVLMFDGTVEFTPAQLKASKNLMCGKKGNTKKNYSHFRILKTLIGSEALNEYEKCVNDSQLEVQSIGINPQIRNPALDIIPMPSIPGCEVESLADRTMRCNTSEGKTSCYNHLRSGNVVDCRYTYRPTVIRDRREVQYRYGPGEYQMSTTGRLVVNLNRGHAFDAVAAGTVNYTINFLTPVLDQRPADQCDPSCPLFGDSPCNRDCVFADHVVELESYSGVATLGRERGDSCRVPLTGELELSTIDKFRAHNLCEHQNAWGRIITGTYYAQVSKFYFFNDFRTTHTRVSTRRNGRNYSEETWSVSNHGERVRNIAELEIPIHIACNN